MWSTSNYARPLQKHSAYIVNIIGQKALCTVLVEFACVARRRCEGWIENESISNYVIKKGCPHGVRHGKPEQQTNHQQAFNARKRWRTGQNFTWNEDRFLKDPRYRQSQEEHGWDQAKCEETNKLAQEDHSYTIARSELFRYSSNWSLQLNSSGRNAPMAARSDYRSAGALKKNHLYRKSEEYQKPIPPQVQDRVRDDMKFSESCRQGARVTGYEPNETDNSDDIEVSASFFQGSRITSSTTLATTARSPHTLRLTTSTSGMRWLHHCTSRREREANASLKQTYHSDEESLFPSAQSILASTVRPVQKRMSRQS